MLKRKIGDLEVSALGLGCMSMSEFYGPALEEAEGVKLIRHAFDKGINFFDTAHMYGTGDNEKLLGKAIRDLRNKVVVATKFGIARKKEDPMYRKICGKPDFVREQCETSLKNLGVEVIDLYYQHRVDPETPIEESVQCLNWLRKVKFVI